MPTVEDAKNVVEVGQKVIRSNSRGDRIRDDRAYIFRMDGKFDNKLQIEKDLNSAIMKLFKETVIPVIREAEKLAKATDEKVEDGNGGGFVFHPPHERTFDYKLFRVVGRWIDDSPTDGSWEIPRVHWGRLNTNNRRRILFNKLTQSLGASSYEGGHKIGQYNEKQTIELLSKISERTFQLILAPEYDWPAKYTHKLVGAFLVFYQKLKKAPALRTQAWWGGSAEFHPIFKRIDGERNKLKNLQAHLKADDSQTVMKQVQVLLNLNMLEATKPIIYKVLFWVSTKDINETEMASSIEDDHENVIASELIRIIEAQEELDVNPGNQVLIDLFHRYDCFCKEKVEGYTEHQFRPGLERLMEFIGRNENRESMKEAVGRAAIKKFKSVNKSDHAQVKKNAIQAFEALIYHNCDNSALISKVQGLLERFGEAVAEPNVFQAIIKTLDAHVTYENKLAAIARATVVARELECRALCGGDDQEFHIRMMGKEKLGWRTLLDATGTDPTNSLDAIEERYKRISDVVKPGLRKSESGELMLELREFLESEGSLEDDLSLSHYHEILRESEWGSAELSKIDSIVEDAQKQRPSNLAKAALAVDHGNSESKRTIPEEDSEHKEREAVEVISEQLRITHTGASKPKVTAPGDVAETNLLEDFKHLEGHEQSEFIERKVEIDTTVSNSPPIINTLMDRDTSRAIDTREIESFFERRTSLIEPFEEKTDRPDLVSGVSIAESEQPNVDKFMRKAGFPKPPQGGGELSVIHAI